LFKKGEKMKKGFKYLLLVSVIIITGCGGGDNTTNSNTNLLGDKFIKIFAIANKAVPIDFERKVFSFEKYNNIYEYINSLKKSIICEKGSINFIVEDNNLSCGTYKIIADNCYVNGKLVFDGEGEVKLINIGNLGCYSYTTTALTNVKYNENILGKEQIITFMKGYKKIYTGNDFMEYNIIANGNIQVDNKIYVLKNFGVYISPYDEFVYNRGNISNGEYSLNFTDLGKKTMIVNGQVVSPGYEIFTVNSKYYGIINDQDNKVYVHDENDTKISNIYNLIEIYSIKED
jgi:hypothetical protein